VRRGSGDTQRYSTAERPRLELNGGATE